MHFFYDSPGSPTYCLPSFPNWFSFQFQLRFCTWIAYYREKWNASYCQKVKIIGGLFKSFVSTHIISKWMDNWDFFKLTQDCKGTINKKKRIVPSGQKKLISLRASVKIMFTVKSLILNLMTRFNVINLFLLLSFLGVGGRRGSESEFEPEKKNNPRYPRNKVVFSFRIMKIAVAALAKMEHKGLNTHPAFRSNQLKKSRMEDSVYNSLTSLIHSNLSLSRLSSTIET